MTYSDLQTLIGALTNDPNHDRYALTDIATELDNTQDKFNLSAKIIKDTITLTTVDGTRQYAFSLLTGTPIAFTRVTHKGIDLSKKSKSYFDLYTGTDWTLDTGTPTIFFIESSDANNQYVTVYPTPQGGDAGANLVVEYIKRHTSMSAASDVPFMDVTSSNPELRAYDFYLAYDVASRLLSRDPSDVNAKKQVDYAKQSSLGLSQIVEVYKALEQDEPMRMSGGRYFR